MSSRTCVGDEGDSDRPDGKDLCDPNNEMIEDALNREIGQQGAGELTQEIGQSPLSRHLVPPVNTHPQGLGGRPEGRSVKTTIRASCGAVHLYPRSVRTHECGIASRNGNLLPAPLDTSLSAEAGASALGVVDPSRVSSVGAPGIALRRPLLPRKRLSKQGELVRKKMLTVGLAAMLSMGVSTAALAQDVTTTTPDVTTQQETNDDNGNAGLWGLLGLLGLGGLAGLRRDDKDHRQDRTRDHEIKAR